MESDKIRQVVLEKAGTEAQQIVEESNVKARQMIEQEKEKQAKRFFQAKNTILSEARREAAKIEAQASLQAQQSVLKRKDEIIEEITKRVQDELAGNVANQETLGGLIQETIDALGSEGKVRLYVAGKDLEIVKSLVAADKLLATRILDINTTDCIGGVMAMDADGLVDIDNTDETRMEMLLPKVLPEIGRKLFGET